MHELNYNTLPAMDESLIKKLRKKKEVSYLFGISIEIPDFEIPSDEERTVNVNCGVSNLFVTEMKFIPHAAAILPPLGYFVTETHHHDLFHRSLCEVREEQPQI